MKRTAPDARQTRRPRHAMLGVSLIEAAICTSIVASISATVLPQFKAARERHRVESLAAQVETDLYWARSAAVARGQSVRVRFDTGGGAGCYVIHTGPANACRCNAAGAATCSTAGEVLQVFRLPGDEQTRIESNSSNMVFDAHRGTVSPTGTVKIISPAGNLHAVVNIMGRVRNCSPDGKIAGFRRC